MRSGVIAQKMGRTRLFTEAGEHVPVTVLRLAQCQVVAHRSKEKDGYVALQLGSGTRKVKNVSKAERGRFAIAKVEPKRTIAEFYERLNQALARPDAEIDAMSATQLAAEYRHLEQLLLAKWDARRYGDKLDLNHGGQDGNPVNMNWNINFVKPGDER